MSNKSTIICGIDVSKDRLDVYLHSIAESTNFTNDKKGISELINILRNMRYLKCCVKQPGVMRGV
jgi:transposase